MPAYLLTSILIPNGPWCPKAFLVTSATLLSIQIILWSTNMAAPFVTGPAHMFVGLISISGGIPGGATSVQYLGTSEGSPDIQHRPYYEGVPNDLGGAVP